MNPLLSFIHDLNYRDLPAEVRVQARRCLLDLIGSLAGGRRTRLSAIIRDHACEVYGGDGASLLFDGRRCSPPGAALANGMTIDSLDIHDSHRESLGHAGVHVFPTILAVAEDLTASTNRSISGAEFLTAMVIGYDVACRAGMALHATVPDYHTSGAWGALSSAALYSRFHGLSAGQTRHALGIAEYHGPRSQMMRVIDHPSMLKDGSGWGAMAGISAGMLAASGFTGAPAVTVEGPEAAAYWRDLGSKWQIMDQGFKVHAVCWWAQPAIEAALSIADQHRLDLGQIQRIEVHTFEKATHLDHPRPATSEEAQYSLSYPVAAALWASKENRVWPGVGPDALLDERLDNPQVLALADRIRLVEAPDLTAQFPGRFLARVTIINGDGQTYESDTTTFRGESDFPLSDAELRDKYRWLAADLLPYERLDAIESAVSAIADMPDIQSLADLLAPQPGKLSETNRK